MANPNEDAIKLNTPFGNIVATGFNAAILLALGALFWIVFDQSKAIIRKVEQVECTTKLSIWVYAQPKGTMPAPVDMPAEVWQCIPEFLIRRK